MAGAIVHTYNPRADVVIAGINASGQVRAAQAAANASRYGSYASGLGNIAQAYANAEGGRSASLGMAEAARQGALGNIGSAALGAFGGAANNALGAWAANQTAYNKAASDMHVANQQGLSQVGSTRNAALAGLGQSYADMAGRMAGANAISGLSFDMSADPSGGFSASGSSNSSTGPAAPNAFLADISKQGFGGINSLRDSIMAGDVLSGLNSQAQQGRNQLDKQHYSSRMMPSQMLEQTRSGLTQFANDAYGNSAMGMNQFYENSPRVGFSRYQSLLDALTGGGTATDRPVDDPAFANQAPPRPAFSRPNFSVLPNSLRASTNWQG